MVRVVDEFNLHMSSELTEIYPAPLDYSESVTIKDLYGKIL